MGESAPQQAAGRCEFGVTLLLQSVQQEATDFTAQRRIVIWLVPQAVGHGPTLRVEPRPEWVLLTCKRLGRVSQ